MSGVVVHRFGPFALDAASQQLFRDKQRIRLPFAHSAVLVHLVSHAGVVVPKETLMEAGWGKAAITQNNLDQAISRLRKVLDDGRTRETYIETLPNEGYRFIGAVQRAERDEDDLPLEEQLAPFRAFLQGRADLYSL